MLHDRVLKQSPLSHASFCVGGIGFELSSIDPGLDLVLDGPTRLFQGPAGPSSFDFEVARADLTGVRPGEVVFEAGAAWTLSRHASEWAFDFFTPIFGATPFRSARLREDLSGGEIRFHPPWLRGLGEVVAPGYPLTELLVIQRLARTGGVELHACGIVDETGQGLLFTGHSGDGKSTTAKLWNGIEGVTVLSDDRIILRPEGDGFRIHGTPWHGEGTFAANASAPLAAVFVVEHGAVNQAIPLSEPQAVAELFPRSFPPFYDHDGVESILESLGGMARSVPCFRFPFVPGPAAVDFVRRTVGGLPRGITGGVTVRPSAPSW